MSIVKMDKISIIGHLSEKEHIVKLLMDKGVVQIEDASFLKEEFGDVLFNDGEEISVQELDRKIDYLDQAIKCIKDNVKEKAPLFSPKRLYVSPEEKEAEIYETAEKINDKNKEIMSLSAEANSLRNLIIQLNPWVKFDNPLNKMETKVTKIILGTIPAKFNFSEIKKQLSAENINALVEQIDKDKQLTYIFAVISKDNMEEALEFLKGYSFVRITLEENENTPKECIDIYSRKIEDIEKEKERLLSEIVSMKDSREDLENLCDSFMMERDRKKVVENFMKTSSVFCATGWLPAGISESIKNEFMEKFECLIETEAPSEDDDCPTLLNNNRFVEPFETVTNMYSPPNKKEVDHSWILAIFFTLFYGMMMGDVGYGIILTLLCGVAVKMSKFKRKEGNLYKLMFFCGISTIIFGFLFGGLFGMKLPVLQVLDPLDEIMRFMGISLTLGIVHLFIALAIKGYDLLKKKDIIGFIGDILGWYVFIFGTVVLITTYILKVKSGFWSAELWSDKALIIFVVGAIMIVATNGRAEKNVFMKIFGGIKALYGITGYFGDVLSYSRIMALCLSSGIVAQVMNQLAGMVWHGPLIVLGIVIILFGHALNLFIGALGAYVHTCRLHYVEFFGKFYEGGGRLFKPFKRNTKYTDADL